jgi:hypothetical protein
VVTPRAQRHVARLERGPHVTGFALVHGLIKPGLDQDVLIAYERARGKR